MITPELLRQAFESATAACDEAGTCNHGDAVRANQQLIMVAMGHVVEDCFRDNSSPSFGLFDLGLHVGYRLAQLEADATVPKEKVN